MRTVVLALRELSPIRMIIILKGATNTISVYKAPGWGYSVQSVLGLGLLLVLKVR